MNDRRGGTFGLLLAARLALSGKLGWRARLLLRKVRGTLEEVSWRHVLLRMLPSGTARKGPMELPERVTIGACHDRTEAEHLVRYQFAKRYCQGLVVADIACGTGYGTNILRKVARIVDGYDKEPLGQEYVIDLERESWAKPYDVIVSFETIEHLANLEFFLANVRNSARLLILSTPVGEPEGFNPFHKQVWSLGEITALLEKFFTCQYYYQAGETIHRDPMRPFQFLLAVGEPRPSSPGSPEQVQQDGRRGRSQHG